MLKGLFTIVSTTLLLAVIAVSEVQSQTLERVDYVSGVVNYEGGNSEINASIGGLVVSTKKLGDYQLTQGFYQNNQRNFSTEIEKETANNIEVYPNPFIDQFEILVEGDYYQIFDFQGRLVLNGEILEKKASIDLRGEDAGQYLIHIIDQEGNLLLSHQVIKIDGND